MNVLSLCDGLSGARLALEKSEIKVNSYYCSEIDKYASAVSRYNFPNQIHLGSVYDWPVWDMVYDLPKFDLLVAGFPCQSYSTAGKQLGLEDIRGQILYYILGAIKYFKPRFIVLENVKGLLAPKFKPVIDLIYTELSNSGYKIQHKLLDSALTSAQARKRVYFTNFEITDPDDKGLFLKDILEDSSNTIGRMVGRKINPKTGKRDDYNSTIQAIQRIEPRESGKCGTLTTVEKDNLVIVDRDKSLTLTSSYRFNPSEKEYTVQKRKQMIGISCNRNIGLIKEVNKAHPLNASDYRGLNRNQNQTAAYNGIKWRKLSPIECERLQTVPDNYTALGVYTNSSKKKISNTQRYKMIGNGFEIGMVSHIFNCMKKDRKWKQ